MFLRRELTENLRRGSAEGIGAIVEKSMVQASNACDNLYLKQFGEIAYKCGATACIVLVVGNKLYCANIGDARAVMSRGGKPISLSKDHKVTTREDEQDRIKKDGGYIVFGRVLGRLAITRAFGDFECKNLETNAKDSDKKEIKSFITCEPEIREVTIDPELDEFVIIASDGLYD